MEGNKMKNRAGSKKLSQYGLFDRKTGKTIASRTERDIYKALGKG